jgi:hypothetical protein
MLLFLLLLIFIEAEIIMKNFFLPHLLYFLHFHVTTFDITLLLLFYWIKRKEESIFTRFSGKKVKIQTKN